MNESKFVTCIRIFLIIALLTCIGHMIRLGMNDPLDYEISPSGYSMLASDVAANPLLAKKIRSMKDKDGKISQRQLNIYIDEFLEENRATKLLESKNRLNHLIDNPQ